MISQQDEKPPFVRFTTKQQEDRNATIENGYYTTKDAHFALITPRGSKDCLEVELTNYLRNMQDAVRQGRFKQSWLEEIKASYEAWKRGEEIPEDGFPLKNWPLLSPAQLTNLLAINVRTVEELAQANEETVTRLGMGGRALSQKAREWLSAQGDVGKAAEQITKLTVALDAAKERSAQLEKQVLELAEQVKQLSKK